MVRDQNERKKTKKTMKGRADVVRRGEENPKHQMKKNGAERKNTIDFISIDRRKCHDKRGIRAARRRVRAKCSQQKQTTEGLK